MDIIVPPTTPVPRMTLCAAKQRSIRRGVKVGEHSLVRIRPALRVGAEGEIEDRRVASEGSHSGAGSPQGTDRRTRRMSAGREIA